MRYDFGERLEVTMRRPKVEFDVKPVSDFLANAATMIEQVRSSGRPLLVTQRGHSSAVLLDVASYQGMVEEIELLRDVRTSIKQIELGYVLSNSAAKEELRKRFARRESFGSR